MFWLAPYLDDSEDDGGEMNGKDQKLTGQEVPDPVNWSLLLRLRAASTAWSTNVKGRSTAKPRHLFFMVDPIFSHIPATVTVEHQNTL